MASTTMTTRLTTNMQEDQAWLTRQWTKLFALPDDREPKAESLKVLRQRTKMFDMACRSVRRDEQPPACINGDDGCAEQVISCPACWSPQRELTSRLLQQEVMLLVEQLDF